MTLEWEVAMMIISVQLVALTATVAAIARSTRGSAALLLRSSGRRQQYCCCVTQLAAEPQVMGDRSDTMTGFVYLEVVPDRRPQSELVTDVDRRYANEMSLRNPMSFQSVFVCFFVLV